MIRLVPPRDGPEPTPDRLAQALAARDHAALESLLGAARRKLQEELEGELYRLAGELVTEVSRQPTLRDKVGRAVSLGAVFLSQLPPQRVLAELEDSELFLSRCRAACEGVITFLAGELNRGLEADGLAQLPPEVATLWVHEAVDHLRISLQLTEEDGVARRAKLASWFTQQFEAECEECEEPVWLT